MREKRRRRILVISPKMPKPDRNSGDKRLVAILEMMARSADVDLCVDLPAHKEYPPLTKLDAERYRLFCRGIGVRVLGLGPLPHPRVFFSPAYDLVFYEFHYMVRRYGRIIRAFAPSAKSVVDSVDIHFLRSRSGASIGAESNAPSPADIEAEVAVYRQADATIVVTSEDASGLNEVAATRRLYLIPNIVPLRPRDDRPRTPTVLFIGGFSHAPNVDAVLWFAREIWPTVVTAINNARFIVIGSNAPAEIAALHAIPGVHFLGYVPDTGPYLDESMVSVAPLRYGAGMKGKVNEAMASGVPVVTTSYGAQGLNAKDQEHLLLADDALTFASSLISLLSDPVKATRIGLAGQRLTHSICSPEIVEATVLKMLDEMAPVARPGFLAYLKNLGLHAALALRGVGFVRTFLRRSKIHTSGVGV